MEKTFEQDVPHTLGKDEARKRIGEGLPKILQALPGGEAQHHWTGDTMFLDYGAFGQSASAQLEIHEDRVHVRVTVTGFLAAMGDKIARLFGRGTQELLEDKSK